MSDAPAQAAVRTRAGGEAAFGSRVMRRLDELARFSGEPNAPTRLFLTAEHKAAAQQVMAWMRAAGMTAGLDAAGDWRAAARHERPAHRPCCSART